MLEQGQEQIPDAPVGERLRRAREEKGLSLDEVARQTRIPIRHLQHIEQEEWDALPAITYTVGFVRSYANAVGLDGPAIGAELRQQLGGTPRGGPATAYYEPADPARVPPRSLAIVAAILAVLLIAGYLTWRHYALGGSQPAEVVAPPPSAPSKRPAAAAPAAAPSTGPVVLAATDAVWVKIYDGARTLYMGTMKAGERFEVPADAQAPQIITGRPNVLQVTVGATAVPPLGPPERRIKDVSLRAADLAARARAGGAPATPPPAAGTR
jgi:cytoskeletal protein RodZ